MHFKEKRSWLKSQFIFYSKCCVCDLFLLHQRQSCFIFFLSRSYFLLSRSVVSVVFLGVLCILTNIVIKHCGRLESISNNAMNVLYNSNAINKYSSTLPIVTRIGGYEICPFTRLFFSSIITCIEFEWIQCLCTSYKISCVFHFCG